MRHKQKPIGHFQRPVSKPAPKAEPQTLQSWWIGKDRAGLNAGVRIEQERMSNAKITGRPVVPDGWR